MDMLAFVIAWWLAHDDVFQRIQMRIPKIKQHLKKKVNYEKLLKYRGLAVPVSNRLIYLQIRRGQKATVLHLGITVPQPNKFIYTIILHKSVCRRSQTAVRNSCSIVSGDVSN